VTPDRLKYKYFLVVRTFDTSSITRLKRYILKCGI